MIRAIAAGAQLKGQVQCQCQRQVLVYLDAESSLSDFEHLLEMRRAKER